MRTFFTADLHFDHDNVLKMCSRDFENIERHNDYIVERINKYVDVNDRLFILGDYSWRAKDYGIKCANKHLIYGNHDRNNYKNYFKTVEDVSELKLEGHKIWLSHYPHAYWPASHYGSFHLYGHMHSERGTPR